MTTDQKRTKSDAGRVIERAIKQHPDVSLVLEIAARSRIATASEPPRAPGVATDTATVPTNSQCPV